MSTFSTQNFNSASYRDFRPGYTEHLYSIIYEFHTSNGRIFENALDIGTGTGQVAQILSDKFKNVFAVDPSAKMLESAVHKPNIQYSVASAENIPVISSHTIDLLTAAQSFHWFNHTDFFNEVKRVLKPNGTFAIFGYSYCMIPSFPQVNELIIEYGTKTLGEYWEPGRAIVEALYTNISIPFSNKRIYSYPPSFISTTSEGIEVVDKPFVSQKMNLQHLESYFRTWSAYKRYVEANPEKADPVIDIVSRIEKVLKAEKANTEEIEVVWPAVLILGRNV